MATPHKEKNSLLKAVVSHIAIDEYDEWPPKCATFLYQPKRPIASTRNKKQNTSGEQKTTVG